MNPIPNDTRKSRAAVNEEANSLGALFNTGYLRIYDGTQPETADTAIDGSTLLAELRFGSPAFGPATDGVLTANPILPDLDAKARGTASWYRCLTAGETPLMDGTNVNIAVDAIQLHAEVSVSSFMITIKK